MLEHGLLFYASIGLIGVATYIVANALLTSEEKFRASEKLDEVGKEGKKNVGIVLQYSRPFFKRYVSPMVANLKNKQNIRKKYKRPLASSGLTDELSADDFYAFKLFLILGFPIVYLGVRQFAELYDWPVTLAPLMGVLGFFYPDIWISGKITERQKGIMAGMPFVVDMLALSVEAGLDFMAAIQKVIEKAQPGPIVEEFTILMKEVKLGASRAEALRAMAWRVNVIEISSFCATLIAADSVGASIAPILKTLSGDIRQKRSSMIEKLGGQAATKMLFPMMFFIVPAVFLVIGGPMAIAMMSQKK